MKRVFLVMAIFSMLLMTSVFAAENDNSNISVLLDYTPVEFDDKPIIQNDSILVPMRALFEALGTEVEWNNEDRSAVARNNLLEIEISVISKVMKKHTYEYIYKIYDADGNVSGHSYPDTRPNEEEVIALNTPPVIVNDRIYVPLRAISEAFGYYVDWDEGARTVTIMTDGSEPVREYEYSTEILGGRLIGFLPYEPATISSSHTFDEFDTSYKMTVDEQQDIQITTHGYLYTSVGNLYDDAVNLRLSPIEDTETVTDGNLEAIEIEPTGIVRNMYQRGKGFLVKLPEGTLARIEFSYNGTVSDKNTQRCIVIASKIISTLTYGGKTFDLSEKKKIQMGNIIIDKPIGFVAYAEMGADFTVYRITKLVSSDAQYQPQLCFYSGGWPSYDEDAISVSKQRGTMFGKRVTWMLEDDYCSFETLIKMSSGEYGQLYYHVFGYAEDDEQRKELIKLAEGARLAAKWEKFGGTDMIESDKSY